MLDFGALPPEINSGRIYAGPGSEPMMVAAAAWDELAAELGTATSGYNSVIDELTSGPWAGPTSAAMVSAVAPYVSWLGAAAAQAEETASQARLAAAAFEAAFAMTVPPPVIAANRVLLASLTATNFFGQNTPAIAATEAQYIEMWAQDAAAMYSYAGSSELARELTRFTSPPNTTAPDGESSQFAAVAQATSSPASNIAQNVATAASQLTSAQFFPTFKTWPFSMLQSQWQDFLKEGLPIPGAGNWFGVNTSMLHRRDQADPAGLFRCGHWELRLVQSDSRHSRVWARPPAPRVRGTPRRNSRAYTWALWAPAAIPAEGCRPPWPRPARSAGCPSRRAGSHQAGRLRQPPPRRWTPRQWVPYGLRDSPEPEPPEDSAVTAFCRACRWAGEGGEPPATAFTNKYGFKRSVLVRPPSAG